MWSLAKEYNEACSLSSLVDDALGDGKKVSKKVLNVGDSKFCFEILKGVSFWFVMIGFIFSKLLVMITQLEDKFEIVSRFRDEIRDDIMWLFSSSVIYRGDFVLVCDFRIVLAIVGAFSLVMVEGIMIILICFFEVL